MLMPAVEEVLGVEVVLVDVDAAVVDDAEGAGVEGAI
jgi:hypothetical protein